MANVTLLYLSKYNPIFLNLTRIAPIHASIKITENCNSRCVTCNVWKNRHHDELTMNEFEDILFQLKNVGIKWVHFTGGEALLRTDIDELIEKAKKLKLEVSLQTNGILLQEKAEMLVVNEIDRIIVSLDGIEKTNDEIRGVRGDYDKVIKGISALRYYGKKKSYDLDISISTTLTSRNIYEIPQLIELCKKLNIRWSFNLLDSNPYFFSDVDVSKLIITDKDLIDRTFDYLFKIKKESPKVFDMDSLSLEFARKYLKNERYIFPCILGHLMIYIDSHANVYSGCWVLSSLGSLREKKLIHILNSKKFNERLLKMYDLKCTGCSCGYDLNCKVNNLPFLARELIKKYWRLIL